MAKCSEERFKAAMETLFDSSGLPDVKEVRREELKASSAFQYPWFAYAYNELGSIESLYRDRYFGISKSSFSKHRSRLDELGRVELANTSRTRGKK